MSNEQTEDQILPIIVVENSENIEFCQHVNFSPVNSTNCESVSLEQCKDTDCTGLNAQHNATDYTPDMNLDLNVEWTQDTSNSYINLDTDSTLTINSTFNILPTHNDNSINSNLVIENGGEPEAKEMELNCDNDKSTGVLQSQGNTTRVTPIVNDSGIYDPDLKEYVEHTYNTLTSLLNGVKVEADNWILLLTKSMYLVSQIKNLNTDKKIKLSVELVIRYLDDYTTMDDNLLINIKPSINNMCVAILSNTGILKDNVTKQTTIYNDPDMLVTPVQLSDLIIKKLINTVKIRNLDIHAVKNIFPELVIMCIIIINKYNHLTGLEKKNLTIQIIQRFITETLPQVITCTPDEVMGLKVLSQCLPYLVDTMVNVGRGKADYKFDFSNPETLSKLQLICLCLLSCMRRRPTVV